MTTRTSAEEIAKQFDAGTITEDARGRPASYNIAPTQQILVITAQNDEREIETMRWGLVPFFAKDLSISARMINARAESVVEKPAYRRAFSKRRCIIPVDGFYEWQKLDSKTKQPWYFHAKNGEMLAFAGLWEVWHDPTQPEDAPPLHSTTVITTAANGDMQEVHNRMPAILQHDEIAEWLATDNTDLADLQRFLESPQEGYLDRYRIGTDVNRASNNSPELLEPIS